MHIYIAQFEWLWCKCFVFIKTCTTFPIRWRLCLSLCACMGLWLLWIIVLDSWIGCVFILNCWIWCEWMNIQYFDSCQIKCHEENPTMAILLHHLSPSHCQTNRVSEDCGAEAQTQLFGLWQWSINKCKEFCVQVSSVNQSNALTILQRFECVWAQEDTQITNKRTRETEVVWVGCRIWNAAMSGKTG